MANFYRQIFPAVRFAKKLYTRVESASVDDCIAGVPRRVQNAQVGLQQYRASNHLWTFKRAWHHHVGKKQVDVHAAVRYNERLFAVISLQHVIAKLDASFAERSDTEGWPAARLLMALAEREIAERDRRRVERHLKEAGLLPGKTLEIFDFDPVPIVSRAHARRYALATAGCATAPI